MKIAIAQLNYHIGNFEGNLQKMKAKVEEARIAGADLICFSELAVCGYPPRDFLEFEDFISNCRNVIAKLLPLSEGVAIVVGGPSVNPVVEGKDLFNSAYFLHEGEIKHVAHKALLPTYDVFDEYRYFEPAREFSTVEFKGKRIAMTVCEDIWNVGNENPLYTICPMDEMMPDKPDLMLNLSASPFNYDQAQTRYQILRANVNRYNVPIFYVNHCGAQTELIFDGGSLVMSPDGRVYDELPYFREDLRFYDLERVIEGRDIPLNGMPKTEKIYKALITGIRDYFGKLGFTKATLGLSGGIDSAVTAALAAHALGPKNIHVLLMPSPYSSSHSVDDAVTLAKNLGINYDIVRIDAAYKGFKEMMYPIFGETPYDVTEENIQSRCRGILLMALSNKKGHILLNTTNKSEMAVGYGTLYGDLAGGLSVLGDVYKTEVYDLAEHINKDEEIIPKNTIDKPPSAELRHDQKDTDSLPEYHILDHILRQYIEGRKGPREIVESADDPEVVLRVLKLVNINEFKRHQTAPVLRVSPKAFGMGRRMPIVAKYLS